MSERGDPVHGEVVSADASAGVAAILYTSGTNTVRALTATEFLEITDVHLVSTVGGTYAFVADTDAAGRRIVKGEADALGGIVTNLSSPFVCPKGVTPKLIAAAGAVALTFEGFIRQV